MAAKVSWYVFPKSSLGSVHASCLPLWRLQFAGLYLRMRGDRAALDLPLLPSACAHDLLSHYAGMPGAAPAQQRPRLRSRGLRLGQALLQ